MDSIFNIEILTQNIIELCERKNISVNRMLQECGLSKNVIDNLKRGFEPRLAKIVIIADYLGVTVDYLINNSPVGTG
ncbi:MAG: helix-turn-helix domain-containing protein [Ruminococcus sp.]|nr:helix-turn-helix domain-containing protein [Ruminococcus sp.]MCM1380844.1 helix-turn-helix domain-containing protein [Muribaculaceae bacterium]MCM1478972.1 helix-turn-helix domain-containing protein [Muribaculaceae bacterium]